MFHLVSSPLGWNVWGSWADSSLLLAVRWHWAGTYVVDGCPLLLRHLQGGRGLLLPLPATPISCRVEKSHPWASTYIEIQIYQMDVGYWNIGELTALDFQPIYIHYSSLHSLACNDGGAEFESLLCSVNAHMRLWCLWICLWSNNLVYFHWLCWRSQQQKLYSLIENVTSENTYIWSENVNLWK